MSIKVNVTKIQSDEKTFPRLMRSRLGQIVLALGLKYPDDKNSTMKIVMLHDNGYSIGTEKYTENFTTELEDFNGELTISNF